MSRTAVAVLVVVVVLAAGGGIVYAATRKPERDDALAAAAAAAAARAGQPGAGDGSIIERLSGGYLSGASAVRAQGLASQLLAEGGRRLTARASEPEVIYQGPAALPPPPPPGTSPGYGMTNPMAPPTTNVTTGASSFGAPDARFAPPPTPGGPAVVRVRQTVGRSRAPSLRRSGSF